MRSSGAALVVLATCVGAPQIATAKKGPIAHRVKERNESYADLADHYYAKRHLERHLRLYNRRPEPLKVGTTILIPTYVLVQVRRGQSLEEFAAAHLNDAGRAEYLAELHRLRGRERKFPRPGKRLRVVQSLKHTVRRGESLRSIANLYYQDTGQRRIRLLMLYNKLNRQKVRTGQPIRIPLDSSSFSYDAVARRARQPFSVKKVVTVAPPTPPPPPPKRRASAKTAKVSKKKPSRAEGKAAARRLGQRLEDAERLYGNGAYAQCEQLAATALAAAPDGLPNLKVELLRLLAFSQIAKGDYGDSKATFKELLALDPKYELDLYRTSPKILDIFEAVAMR